MCGMSVHCGLDCMHVLLCAPSAGLLSFDIELYDALWTERHVGGASTGSSAQRRLGRGHDSGHDGRGYDGLGTELELVWADGYSIAL